MDPLFIGFTGKDGNTVYVNLFSVEAVSPDHTNQITNIYLHGGHVVWVQESILKVINKLETRAK